MKAQYERNALPMSMGGRLALGEEMARFRNETAQLGGSQNIHAACTKSHDCRPIGVSTTAMSFVAESIVAGYCGRCHITTRNG